jgi:hypothetical protein
MSSKSNIPNKRCSFSALKLGDVFVFGSKIAKGAPAIEWYKTSNRTARLVENNRVFYFKSGEVVTSTGKNIYTLKHSLEQAQKVRFAE